MSKNAFAALFFIFISTQIFAFTRYVSTTGASSYPYDTWATAATNIQDAVNAAIDGDTVLVGPGTYSTGGGSNDYGLSRVVITNGVAVQSLDGPQTTIIEGSKSSYIRCAYINHSGAALLGFTLTNGATRSRVFCLSSISS